MFRWARPKELRAKGVLGMNERNTRFISAYNSRQYFPLVDDKLKTKRLAERAGVAVPKLIDTLNSQYQVSQAAKLFESLEAFVIKPAKGSGGKGILVICGRDQESFIKPSGDRISLIDIQRHLSNTLGGLYSLGGKPDIAMIETLVEFDPIFDQYSYEGVPDVRIISFLGFPVMAMLRLSTQDSDGKANLHQGAVGVGLDLRTGQGLSAVQFNRPISKHPDTGTDFTQLKVPHWEQILNLSANSFEMTKLGYIGCDIVLDKNRGPLILELNARPGLAIQIANAKGLRPRLATVEKLAKKNWPAEKRIAFSLENFTD